MGLEQPAGPQDLGWVLINAGMLHACWAASSTCPGEGVAGTHGPGPSPWHQKGAERSWGCSWQALVSLGRCPLLSSKARWWCHGVIQADGAGGDGNCTRRAAGSSVRLKGREIWEQRLELHWPQILGSSSRSDVG